MKWFVEFFPLRLYPRMPSETVQNNVEAALPYFDVVNIASPLPAKNEVYEDSLRTASKVARTNGLSGRVLPYIVCRDYDNAAFENLLGKYFDSSLFYGVLVLGGDGYQEARKRFSSIITPRQAIKEIKKRAPDLPVGVGFNPNVDDLEAEVQKLQRKAEYGADFALADLIFDQDRFFEGRDMARELKIGIPLIPEVTIIKNEKHALETLEGRFKVRIPQHYKDRIKGRPNDEVRKIGIEIAVDVVEELRKEHDVCICAPREVETALEVISAFK